MPFTFQSSYAFCPIRPDVKNPIYPTDFQTINKKDFGTGKKTPQGRESILPNMGNWEILFGCAYFFSRANTSPSRP